MNKLIRSIKINIKSVLIFIFAVTVLILLSFAIGKNTAEPYDENIPQIQIQNQEQNLNLSTSNPLALNENESEIPDAPQPSGDTADQPEQSEPLIAAIEHQEETTLPPVKIKKTYQDKFDSLRAKYSGNEDIIGIIKIPETTIYYPVAYYPYNNEYYLARNLLKQFSAAGSICMDYENSVERYDPSTILYGHQMSSNTMFHSISYYNDEDFFNNHRYVIFNTIYEDNVWEVFAFFMTHISFNYIKVFFRSESDFLDLAAEMKEKSLYDTGIEITEGDRILVLSTCTNKDPDTRYVLCARLIKNKADIPTDIAEQMTSAIEDFR